MDLLTGTDIERLQGKKMKHILLRKATVARTVVDYRYHSRGRPEFFISSSTTFAGYDVFYKQPVSSKDSGDNFHTLIEIEFRLTNQALLDMDMKPDGMHPYCQEVVRWIIADIVQLTIDNKLDDEYNRNPEFLSLSFLSHLGTRYAITTQESWQEELRTIKQAELKPGYTFPGYTSPGYVTASGLGGGGGAIGISGGAGGAGGVGGLLQIKSVPNIPPDKTLEALRNQVAPTMLMTNEEYDNFVEHSRGAKTSRLTAKIANLKTRLGL